MSSFLSCQKVGYSISDSTIPLDYRDDLCDCETGNNCCNWTILSGVCCDSGICCPHPTGNILRAVYPWPEGVTDRDPIERAAYPYPASQLGTTPYGPSVENGQLGGPATEYYHRWDDYFYKNDNPASKLSKAWDTADAGAVFRPAGQLLGMVAIRDSAGDEYVNQFSYQESSFTVFQVYANHGMMPKSQLCHGEQEYTLFGGHSIASGYHEQAWLVRPFAVTVTNTIVAGDTTPTWTLVGGYTASGIPAATTNVIPTTTQIPTAQTTTTPGGYRYTTSDGLNVLTPYTTTATLTSKMTSSVVMTTNFTEAATSRPTETDTFTTELMVLSDDIVRITNDGGNTTYTPLSGSLIQSASMWDTPQSETDYAELGGEPDLRQTEVGYNPYGDLHINTDWMYEPFTSISMVPISITINDYGTYRESYALTDDGERYHGFRSYILATDGAGNYKRVGFGSTSSSNGFSVGAPFNPLDRYIWENREQDGPRIYIPTDKECFEALETEELINPSAGPYTASNPEKKIVAIPDKYGWATYKKAEMSTDETFVGGTWGGDDWDRRAILDYVPSWPKMPTAQQVVGQQKWALPGEGVSQGSQTHHEGFPIDDCGCRQPWKHSLSDMDTDNNPGLNGYLPDTLGSQSDYNEDPWNNSTRIKNSEDDYEDHASWEADMTAAMGVHLGLSSRSVYQNEPEDKGIEMPSEKTVLKCFNKLVEDMVGGGWKVACINDMLGEDFAAPSAGCREKYTHTDDHKYVVTNTNKVRGATTYHSSSFDGAHDFNSKHPKLPETKTDSSDVIYYPGTVLLGGADAHAKTRLKCMTEDSSHYGANTPAAFDGCGNGSLSRAKFAGDFIGNDEIPEELMPLSTHYVAGRTTILENAHDWSLLQYKQAHTHVAEWHLSAFTGGRGNELNAGAWSAQSVTGDPALIFTLRPVQEGAQGRHGRTTFTTADLGMTSTAKPGDGVAQWTWTTGEPSMSTNAAGGIFDVGDGEVRNTPTPVGNLTLTAAYRFGPEGTTLSVLQQRYTVESTTANRQTETIIETPGAEGTDTTMTAGLNTITPVDGKNADPKVFRAAIKHEGVGIYVPYYYGKRFSDFCILNHGCDMDIHAGDLDNVWRAGPLREEFIRQSLGAADAPRLPKPGNIELAAPCVSCNDAAYTVSRTDAMSWLSVRTAQTSTNVLGVLSMESQIANYGGGTSMGGWMDWLKYPLNDNLGNEYSVYPDNLWHGTDPWLKATAQPAGSSSHNSNLGDQFEPYGGCRGNAGLYAHLREHVTISKANAETLIDICNLGLADWATNSVPQVTRYRVMPYNGDPMRDAVAADNCPRGTGNIGDGLGGDGGGDEFGGEGGGGGLIDYCEPICMNCWSSPTSQRANWNLETVDATILGAYQAGLPKTWLTSPADFYGVSESDYRKSRCCGGSEVNPLGASAWEDEWDGVQCGPIPDEYNKCYLTRTGAYEIGSATGAFMGAVDGGMYWDDINQPTVNYEQNYNFQYAMTWSGITAEGETDLGSSRNLTNENFIKTELGAENSLVVWTTRLEFQNQTCVQPGRINVSCAGKSGDIECFNPDNIAPITSGGGGISSTIGNTTLRRGEVGSIDSEWGESGRTYILGSQGTHCDDCDESSLPSGTTGVVSGINYTGALYELSSGCYEGTGFNSSPDSQACYRFALPHEDLFGLFYDDLIRNDIPSQGFDGGIPFIDPSDNDSQKRIGHDTSVKEGSDFTLFCSPSGGEPPFETKWEFYYPSIEGESPTYQDFREHVEAHWTEKFGSLEGLTGWHSLTGDKSGLAYAFLKNPYNEDGTQAGWVDAPDSYSWKTDTTTRYTRHVVTDGKNHIEMNLLLNNCSDGQFSGASGDLSMLTIHIPKKFGEDLPPNELLPRAAGGYDSESFDVYNQYYATNNQTKDNYRYYTVDSKNNEVLGNSHTDIVRNLLTTKYRATITDKEGRSVTTQTFEILEKRYKPIRLWAPDWIDVEDSTNTAQSSQEDLYNEMWQVGWPNWGTSCALAFSGEQNATNINPMTGSWYWKTLMPIDVFVDTQQINQTHLDYLNQIGQPVNYPQPDLKVCGTTIRNAFAEGCCADSKEATFNIPLIHNTNTIHEEDGSLAFEIKENQKYGKFHNANLGINSTYIIFLGDQCETKHTPKHYLTLRHSTIGESYPVAEGSCNCNSDTDCGPYWSPS